MPTQIFYWRPSVGGTAAGTVTPTPAVPCDLPIDCMRDTINSILRGTAIVYGLTQAGDGFGGQTDTYAPTGTASCSIVATGKMREFSFADAVRSVPEFQITMPYGTAVYGRNRIYSDGSLFEVVGTNGGVTVDLSTQALCVRIDG